MDESFRAVMDRYRAWSESVVSGLEAERHWREQQDLEAAVSRQAKRNRQAKKSHRYSERSDVLFDRLID
jgi:hypothetical protein